MTSIFKALAVNLDYDFPNTLKRLRSVVFFFGDYETYLFLRHGLMVYFISVYLVFLI